MRLLKCWFCSSNIYPGRGIMFVRNDCKVMHFCRSKCHANFKMKRNPRKLKWTKAYRAVCGKDLVNDSTFEFERRRNRPEKYDRELVGKTMEAIDKVTAIRHKRQQRHIEKRQLVGKAKDLKEARKVLEDDIHLVKAPVARAREKTQKAKLLAEEPANMES